VKWTAEHWDGFTTRLFCFTLNGVDEIAELDAKWFRPDRHRSKCVAKTIVEIDDAPIRKILPILRGMDALYDCHWDDVGSKILTIEIDGEVIKRKVRGGGLLVDKHPELRPFMKLFEWLESQVLSHIKNEMSA
jgi:hypothetical protein